MKAYACQDYAGGFSVAMRRAGFEITHKVEQPDKFGLDAYRMNLALFGGPATSASHADSWPHASDINVLFGNPPCSAFSLLTQDPKFREGGSSGAEARQNHCMWDLIDMGVRLNPDVVMFESVQRAGRSGEGRKLMLMLRDRLEQGTGVDWHLTHVFLNALSVGGAQNRPRYFFVATKAGPVSMPPAKGYARPLKDIIGDLVDRVEPSGPYSWSTSPRMQRLAALAEVYWPQGRAADEALPVAREMGFEGHIGRSDAIRCPFTAWRWKWDAPPGVVTGGFMDDHVHPIRARGFTHAEAARLMGLPDEYDLSGIVAAKTRGRSYYGKATSVEPAHWVARGIMGYLTNQDCELIPQEVVGGTREYMIDVTEAWRANRLGIQESLFE